MKIVSFNVNGIRAHLHQVKYLIKVKNPDIIGLQETKVTNTLFPKEEFIKLGYNIYVHGQKKNHGVALLSRYNSFNIQKKNFNFNIDQKRFIMMEINSAIGNIKIINCYFPQGDNRFNTIKFNEKIYFFNNLYKFFVNNLKPTDHIIMMGDINVSITDLDIGFNTYNRQKWLKLGKCSFLPEERLCVYRLIKWGLYDIWRIMHPNINNKFSWFDYRFKSNIKNIGLRIDVIFISKSLKKYYVNSDIDYNIRNMIKPSDHAPIWIELKI
ncbi:exodeoxyribonuclease III [Enterobacteriaceae endosymbiont of Neohaemonia nigricornis]|uniref:exodeoxyribonuclease III n=1 Tax=Enterobacteriaceae endosymbiont of Neohaemonia nigricornis TaxID=2675792 RepID=UPI0014494490|nr:exodeoxyribonuclease III [Enterobacteriaceae endosymbiont of Neohaemonia nigricornis]QJC30293.1 exodeoxyribonuclease III [Enterobacteriaceae endosymbiont of Neohaemonia nigricornis]